MAAGRVVVLSGDSHHVVSRRGLSHLRNGTRGAKLAHRCDSGNRPRYEDNLVIQPNRGRDFGPRLCGFDELSRVDEAKIPNFAFEFHPPPQKKRKFSPILWNIEKVSKTSAKSEVPEKEASSVGAHGIVYPTSTTHGEISDSTAFLFAHLPQEDDEQGEQMSEECFQARGISMSRWASDDECHGDTSSEKVVPESDLDIKGRLSLESGEFIREVPEADKDILPGSAGSSCSKRSSSRIDSVESEEKGNEVMEIDDECLSELQVGADESTEGGMDRVQCCRSVDEFEKLNRISEGTYGVVYRARDKKTGKIVALKKVKILNHRDFEEYGFPLTSLREINILASMNHPSIVNIEEVVVDSKDTVFMVMEYMDHDLRGLLDKMEQPFSTSDVKCLMLQLLEGVRYLHDNWVLHRDLKTSNLLFNNQGELKICDFGMARQYGSPLQPYSTRVVTQYYRAPELLLGAKKYSTAVDMWSVGCIMAELLLKEPLFQGTNEIDQLTKIFKTLGTPNDKLWPGFSQLPGAKAKFLSQPYNLLRKKFPGIAFTGAPTLSDLGLDLMNRLLTCDPQKRISAEDALNHGWFREVPLAKCKDFMPTFPLKAY